ncbi:MAG: hypothetical protein ABSG49_08040 [Methanoregula sp.]|jgi:hypothetical protein
MTLPSLATLFGTTFLIAVQRIVFALVTLLYILCLFITLKDIYL